MDGGDAHLGCFLAMLLCLGGLGIVYLVYLDIFPLTGICFTDLLGEFCLGNLSILVEILTWSKSLRTRSSSLEV